MHCCCHAITDTLFNYFAYGSNLLKKRIQINNPSAEFIGIGRLADHSIDFDNYSQNWCGAVATIVPTKGAYIWGAIWRLHKDNLPDLDKQEGVESKTYFAKTVVLLTSDKRRIECRTYQLTQLPPVRNDAEELPVSRRPSITYLDCILKGAIECKLPEDYVQKLRKVPHNGREASAELRDKLQN